MSAQQRKIEPSRLSPIIDYFFSVRAQFRFPYFFFRTPRRCVRKCTKRANGYSIASKHQTRSITQQIGIHTICVLFQPVSMRCRCVLFVFVPSFFYVRKSRSAEFGIQGRLHDSLSLVLAIIQLVIHQKYLPGGIDSSVQLLSFIQQT